MITNQFFKIFFRYVSKIIMFQKALQFRFASVFCYNKQITMRITSQVLPPLTL